jgi:1,2-diacylglycerol-3-alpha-glucose alpha-1,2-galactosyltransferase
MQPEFVQYLLIYGYPAIFLLIYLIEIGIPLPIPNELLLVFAGYLVFGGILNVYALIAVAVAADFLGTVTLYTIFYFSGKFLMANKPVWFPLSDSTLFEMRQKVHASSWAGLFIFRITPFIRGYASVGSGLLRLKPSRYLILALFSSIAVCCTYIVIGMIIGPLWKTAEPIIFKTMYHLFIAVLLTTCIYLIKRFMDNRSKMKFDAERLDFLSEGTIKVHMVSETEFATKGQGVHTAYMEMLQLLGNVRNLFLKTNGTGRGNIFHSHTYGPYYFWKGLGYPGRRILTAHVIPSSSKGAIPFWNLLLPLTKRYLKLAYSYADVVLAISPEVEREILELGVKSEIIRIYNPVIVENWQRTAEKRSSGRASLGVQNDEKLVIGVGQLQERKGVEDFIDVALALPETNFVWIGGRPMGIFTEGISRINKRIREAPANIQFTGIIELSEMPKMYAAADVFLFPSYQENCPLAPLEASAAGLPVVFRNIMEYKSLFEKEYLHADTTQEFINMTRSLLTEPMFYQNAVKISTELIKEFDQERIKQQLIELYHSKLNNYYHVEQKAEVISFI